MHDMNTYLDADSLRRQANTVVRLTVVTIFGLVGTVTTGFLGMNLLAMAERPLVERVLVFGVVFVATAWLTMYTIGKSKRLSDFLDVLSEEGLPWRTRLGALVRVWRPAASEVKRSRQTRRASDGSAMPRASSSWATLPRVTGPSRISWQPASPARTRSVELSCGVANTSSGFFSPGRRLASRT